MHPIDERVGKNLREKRIMCGMTQEELANSIGLTYQQLQKYERGVNRVSASRLVEMAQALSVPVIELFAGTIAEADAIAPPILEHVKRTTGMVRQYMALPERIQTAIAELVRAMGEESLCN